MTDWTLDNNLKFMAFNRFLPLIVPLLVFALFELFYFNPDSLYLLFVFVFLLILFSGRQLILASKKNEKWNNIVLLPIYLSFSAILLSIMIPIDCFFGKFIIQALFIFVAILLYYYYRFLYFYLINPNKYKKHSLEFFSSYANFLSIYLLASAIFGLKSFLNVSIWSLMLLMLFSVIIIVYEVMWVNKIVGPRSYFYIALVCLTIFELAWVISFLTLSYYILGLLIAIAYYVLIGLVRFHLLKIINKKIIKTYLTLGFVSLLIVLLTARWI